MISRVHFHAMGCQMMAALDSASAKSQFKLAEVSAWFEQWEQVLSRFRVESELSQLNRSGGSPRPVSPVLAQVYQAAQEAERLSGGLVTPLVLDALHRAGYNTSFENMSQNQRVVSVHSSQPDRLECAVLPLSHVAFDQQAHTLQLPAGVGLDFGGVAKGWAAHQAMRRLQVYGPALVDAGGDLAISGLRPGGQPWVVDVASPYQQDHSLVRLAVGRAGIATSGRDYRRWETARGHQHHLIDPRTAEPAVTDVLAVTVVAPDVLLAETAAKTALILGSQAGLRWLDAQPNLSGLLALEDGTQRQTAGFAQYVVTTSPEIVFDWAA